MAAELFTEGKAALESGNLPEAMSKLTEAIEQNEKEPLYRIERARVYSAMGKDTDALSDANAALALDSNSAPALLQKGIALFNLEEYESAKEIFEEGIRLEDDNLNSFKTWKRKCDAEIDMKSQDENGHGEGPVIGIGDGQPDVPVKVAPPKIRYDWYQTDQHVIITIMIKNMKKDDVHVNFAEKSVSVTIKLPSGSDYSLELDLHHFIQPQRSIIKVMTTKIELKMPKVEAIRWSSLEGQPDVAKIKHITTSDSAVSRPTYPSSHHGTASKDWDKLVAEIRKEEKDEKLDGDAALNKFFQEIYSGASEETKRAMNKSFQESGGTVLSTNWGEIGGKKTDMKPPEGMEWKKY
ncbi:protein SGT1 homolog [Oscarella lobularis]|uniref:protein SGT1 homolog n=1 Tax=Oscarella lobularis TaxID=121494 RepID=UPI00331400C5